MEIPTNITEEIQNALTLHPQIHIQSKTTSFLSGSYERTPYTKIKFTLTFPNGYPDHPLIVDITQDNIVPLGLKKKLEKDVLSSDELPIGT